VSTNFVSKNLVSVNFVSVNFLKVNFVSVDFVSANFVSFIFWREQLCNTFWHVAEYNFFGNVRRGGHDNYAVYFWLNISLLKIGCFYFTYVKIQWKRTFLNNMIPNEFLKILFCKFEVKNGVVFLSGERCIALCHSTGWTVTNYMIILFTTSSSTNFTLHRQKPFDCHILDSSRYTMMFILIKCMHTKSDINQKGKELLKSICKLRKKCVGICWRSCKKSVGKLRHVFAFREEAVKNCWQS